MEGLRCLFSEYGASSLSGVERFIVRRTVLGLLSCLLFALGFGSIFFFGCLRV
jgi:hypothetical protein